LVRWIVGEDWLREALFHRRVLAAHPRIHVRERAARVRLAGPDVQLVEVIGGTQMLGERIASTIRGKGGPSRQKRENKGSDTQSGAQVDSPNQYENWRPRRGRIRRMTAASLKPPSAARDIMGAGAKDFVVQFIFALDGLDF
jgi:hypothetical protein